MSAGRLVIVISCVGLLVGARLALGPWGLTGVSLVMFVVAVSVHDASRPTPPRDLSDEAQAFLAARDGGRR